VQVAARVEQTHGVQVEPGEAGDVGVVRRPDRAVELVDVFPEESAPESSAAVDAPRSGWPRWSWLAVAAAALLVGSVVLQGRWRSGSPTPTRPTGPAAAAGATRPAASAAPVTVIKVGRPLLAVPTQWDLFGQGSGVVVRMQLASGRVTITRLPADSARAPTALVALPGRVVVRPVAYGVGYVVPDGAAANRLSGRLGQAGPAVPGPGRGQVWVRTSPPYQDATRMTLIGPGASAAGTTAVGPSVVIPGDGYLTDDGTGHVMYTTRVNNESYLTSPGRWQLRTTGQLLAVGANEVVTIEDAGPGRYSTVLTDVLSGHRRVWRSRGFLADPVLGPVAPGGRTAAVLTNASTATRLNLLDLSTGIQRGPGIALAGNAESLAWSPDGRWLFAVAANGAVVAIDARTAAVHRLGVSLPALTQLVVRP
jgi:hypothetical protein